MRQATHWNRQDEYLRNAARRLTAHRPETSSVSGHIIASAQASQVLAKIIRVLVQAIDT